MQRGCRRVGDDQAAVAVGGHLAERVAERVPGSRALVMPGVGDAARDPRHRVAVAGLHAERVEPAGPLGDDPDQGAHVVAAMAVTPAGIGDRDVARRVQGKAGDPAVGGLAGRAVVAQALVVAVRGAASGDGVLAAGFHGLAVEAAGPLGKDLDLGPAGEQDVAGLVDVDAADRVDRVGQEDEVAGTGVDALDDVAGADVERVGR